MKVYVASRGTAARAAMWRDLRGQGMAVTASWIENADENTLDFTVLWPQVVREIHDSDALLMYAEAGDFPFRGALVEVGVALGAGIPVHVALAGVALAGPSLRPLGAWAHHPLVTLHEGLGSALAGLGYGHPA